MIGLSTYARRLVDGPEKLKASLVCPLLVWEAPSDKPEEILLLATQAGHHPSAPRAGEPLVFEIKKGSGKSNAFAMGVTVGRTDNNDIVLDHNSVSRFHAYFQKDMRTGAWKLVDAESKNGSWVGPLKLKANVAEAVADQARLRFGEVDVRFFDPAGFIEYLSRMMNR